MASKITFAILIVLGKHSPLKHFLIIINLVGLFHVCSSKATGYLYSADPNGANTLMKDLPSDVVFNDVDLRHLIAHNLGLLDNTKE